MVTKSRILVRSLIVLFWTGVTLGLMYCSALCFMPYQTRSINVCTWPGIFDLRLIAAFEKETGIHVNLSYYESNEELFLKLHPVNHGYDLILPSDYAVYQLIERKMLKKIDKSKINFLPNINPLLLNHYFDKNNEFSLPFEWSVYVLGYNKEYYGENAIPQTWGLIFDKTLLANHRVLMTNDPLVAVPIAAFYLFGTIKLLSVEQIKQIKKLLSSQYPFVVAYSDFRQSYYLASGNASIAVSPSSYILRAMRENPQIDFVIPKEGSLVTIENFALPCSTTEDDLVYAFMNFMMRPQNVAYNYEYSGVFPATLDALALIPAHPKAHALLTMNQKEFGKYRLLHVNKLRALVSDVELQNLWVEIKV